MTKHEDVRATLRFLKREELYKTVKSYNLEFRSDEIPISNIISDQVTNLLVKDVREHEDEFTFSTNGFAVLELKSTLSYADFKDNSKVEHVYCQEVASALIEYTGASAVQVFDVQIRTRHPDFPFSGVNLEVNNQPAVQAHIDATPKAVESLIRALNSSAEADTLLRKGYIYANVWKPLAPVTEWPLAVCDAASVDAEDLMAHDTVFSTSLSRENAMVHYNTRQRWYYLSNQLPSEVWLFRQCDSTGKMGVPHSSFEHQTGPIQLNQPRESIEVRAIMYFD